MFKNIVQPGRPQLTIWRMRIAGWTNKATNTHSQYVESSWNVMAHGDAREGKWRGKWRMEWVASTLSTTSEHGVSSITTADAHSSAASSRQNLRPRRFKWTGPFRRKTKSGFCACAITFQTQSNNTFATMVTGTRRHVALYVMRVLICVAVSMCWWRNMRRGNSFGPVPTQRIHCHAFRRTSAPSSGSLIHTTSKWSYMWLWVSNKMQQLLLFFAMALLYMFRVTIPPIIRSTYAVYGLR